MGKGVLKGLSTTRPIIEGKVGNKPAYFLLDTGASLALLDESQLDDYNLEKDRVFPGNIIGTGGTVIQAYYCKNSIKIGSKELNGFLLTNLEQIRHSIKRETGIDILGIISYTQMKNLEISICPSKNEIYGI